MPMIRLRCGGGTILLEPLEDPDDPSLSTKCCPELAKHLDIPLGVDCNHGHNLVGDTGDVSPQFFRRGGHNMSCPPTFFSLDFVSGEVSKIKVMFVTFCVKSFSC